MIFDHNKYRIGNQWKPFTCRDSLLRLADLTLSPHSPWYNYRQRTAVMRPFTLLLDLKGKRTNSRFSSSFRPALSELDIMFNLEKVHMIFEEVVLDGHVVETNKDRILAPIIATRKEKSSR
ncbi:hypothetical protein BC938DRAFT_475614 [Jimgerdemannia flammicorona]|uniref:AP complex mu/sigma subunit domain-containing protein n=1 Tax=Jimgerdemannia flammicorona TaxID=994334 RepID=A0A433QZB8_9FUNG|nr:hypothetical protein BC938DRAFT_475614 [Jimgerdemannia flammicorona]